MIFKQKRSRHKCNGMALSRQGVPIDDEQEGCCEIVPINDVQKGCCAFASKFYRAIACEKQGNIVASPYNMHLMLTYLFHGSDGLSAEDILAALRLLTGDGLRQQYWTLSKIIDEMEYYRRMHLTEWQEHKIALHVTSAIFHQKKLQLELAFKTTGKQFYNFNFVVVDFGDKNNAAKSINLWFAEATKNELKNILSPEDISNRTKVMMVSTMYLAVEWQCPFRNQDTQPEEFFITKNLKKQVFMMQQRNVYRYGELPSMKSKFIDLPFQTARFDMIVILPDEIEGLKFLEDHFNWNTIANILAPCNIAKGTTDVRVPRFKIETTVDLKSIRNEMRLESIFEERGDFERMAKTLVDSRMKVDGIIQKVFLDVNESGTDASLLYSDLHVQFERSRRDGTNVFVVNRPFLVVIRLVNSNIPLFVASVRDIGEEITKVETPISWK